MTLQRSDAHAPPAAIIQLTTPQIFFGMAAPHRTLQDNEDHSHGFQSKQDDMRYCFSFHCNNKKNTYVGSATDYFPHYKAADWRRLLMTFDLSGYSLPTFQTSGCATRRPVKKDCPSLEAWMKLANTKYGLY